MCVRRVNSLLLLLLFTVVLLSCIWLWLFNRLSSSHTVVQGVNSSECKEIQIQNTHTHAYNKHTCINYGSFVYVAYLSVRSKTSDKDHCAAGRAACRATTRVGRMMALSIFLPLQPRTQQQQEWVRWEKDGERGTVMEEWGLAGSCGVALILTSLSQGKERESTTTKQHNSVRACLAVCVCVRVSQKVLLDWIFNLRLHILMISCDRLDISM